MNFQQQLDWARSQDRGDPLASLREQFALPPDRDGRPQIYLCGHSLGLAPRAARALVAAEIADWERLGVRGHEHARTPWIEYSERLQGPLAELCGAQPLEVIAMNSLTVNLHLLLASFYRPQGTRRAVLTEAGAFSSDRHALAAQIRWHGFNPDTELLELAPRPGEDLLRIEDIEMAIAQASGRLALLLWPAVQFRTGQRFDLRRLTRAAHAAGCPIGIDLAHAIGNLPLSLHEDEADFAVWCSYKYLNSGPGAIGGAFVHQRHWSGGATPALSGWWGHEPASRFKMATQFLPAAGAAAFALSNPPILSSAPLRASLPLFAAAGMPALRKKSVALTTYLQSLLEELAGPQLTLITPGDTEQRGCQLSWHVRRGGAEAARLITQLDTRGVICDFREPDILRMSAVPLYNRFEDMLQAASRIAELLRQP